MGRSNSLGINLAVKFLLVSRLCLPGALPQPDSAAIARCRCYEQAYTVIVLRHQHLCSELEFLNNGSQQRSATHCNIKCQSFPVPTAARCTRTSWRAPCRQAGGRAAASRFCARCTSIQTSSPGRCRRSGASTPSPGRSCASCASFHLRLPQPKMLKHCCSIAVWFMRLTG